MKVGLQTWGTEGDVRPFIALGARLVRSGHSVSLSVTEIMNGDYSRYGERFGFPVIHPGHIDLSHEEFTSLGTEFVASKNPALKSRVLVDNFLTPSLDAMYETALEMCRNCDIVVGHVFAYSLRAAALKTGTPWVALYTTPVIPSKTVPAPGFPDFFHSMGWKAFSRALDLLWKPDIDEFFRRRDLPLPTGVFREVFHSEYLNLVAASPSLYPGGGLPGYSFCGTMEIPPEGKVFLSNGLEEFLSRGDPPVFITFGSMFHGEGNKEELADLVIEAVSLAGCRAVIQAEEYQVLENVFFTGRVPHSLVFPRCSLVVHHGGCGTSHAACAAGVPSVVVEYTSDQPMWGKILKRVGVAPKLLHRRSLTSTELAAAIKKVVGDPVFRAKSAAIAVQMKLENGVKAAVNLIEEKFGG